ncbi:MAG: acyl-CoA dehydrogenase family protein [Chloroflexota bacterium]
MGGIGYTDIYPVERLLRDVRLITTWTGTNEIMDLVIQSEFYKGVPGGEVQRPRRGGRCGRGRVAG